MKTSKIPKKLAENPQKSLKNSKKIYRIPLKPVKTFKKT
jgi:hypothetical protein